MTVHYGSGDRVLEELASRVLSSVRAGDTVARFGGDEFIVLLDGVTGAPDAAYVAAKVLEAVQAPYRLGGHRVSIAASVGVGVYPMDGTSPDELVRSADTAMYREKRRTSTHRPETMAQPDPAAAPLPRATGGAAPEAPTRDVRHGSRRSPARRAAGDEWRRNEQGELK